MNVLESKKVVIFGDGDLGVALAKHLAKEMCAITLVSRYGRNMTKIQVFGYPGQINHIKHDCANISEETLSDIISGAYCVYNLVRAPYASPQSVLKAINTDFPEKLVHACRVHNVRLVHLSSILNNNDSSNYTVSQKIGTDHIAGSIYKKCAIVQSGLLYGNDSYLTSFYSSIASISPIVPIVGKGKTIHITNIEMLALGLVAVAKSDNNFGKSYLAVSFSLKEDEFVRTILEIMKKKRLTISYNALFKVFFKYSKFLNTIETLHCSHKILDLPKEANLFEFVGKAHPSLRASLNDALPFYSKSVDRC